MSLATLNLISVTKRLAMAQRIVSWDGRYHRPRRVIERSRARRVRSTLVGDLKVVTPDSFSAYQGFGRELGQRIVKGPLAESRQPAMVMPMFGPSAVNNPGPWHCIIESQWPFVAEADTNFKIRERASSKITGAWVGIPAHTCARWRHTTCRGYLQGRPKLICRGPFTAQGLWPRWRSVAQGMKKISLQEVPVPS